MAQLWSVDTGGVDIGGDSVCDDAADSSTALTDPTDDSTTASLVENSTTANYSSNNINDSFNNRDNVFTNSDGDISSNNNVNIGSDNNSYQYTNNNTNNNTACRDVGAAEVDGNSTGGSGEHLSSSTPTNSGMNTQDMTAVIEEPDATRGNLSLVMSNRLVVVWMMCLVSFHKEVEMIRPHRRQKVIVKFWTLVWVMMTRRLRVHR